MHTQQQTIKSIAALYPLVGGLAVYKARPKRLKVKWKNLHN